MTPPDKNHPPSGNDLPLPEEALFDLLVDGELSAAQRRDLLASLDRHPDGWRRCATAFLESQCWKQDFCGVLPRPQEEPTSPLTTDPLTAVPASKRGPASRPWGTYLAVAASFLIALGIGTQIRLGRHSDRASGLQSAQTAGVAGPTRGSREAPLNRESQRPWEPVILVSDGDPSRAVEVPGRESDRWDTSSWDGDVPAMPEELFRALRQTGHEVQRSRQFVTVPLPDGRRLAVPVDQVDIRRSGLHEYQ